MVRLLPMVVELALLIYCLVDCIQTDEYAVRGLDKAWWIVLILFVPIVGPICWLILGRPQAGSTQRPNTPSQWHAAAATRPVAPDDDPAFLDSLRRGNAAHEEMLKKWEADLRRREGELKKPEEGQPEG